MEVVLTATEDTAPFFLTWSHFSELIFADISKPKSHNDPPITAACVMIHFVIYFYRSMCDILFMHHVGFSSTNILYSKFDIWAWQHTKAKVRCVRMGCLHVYNFTLLIYFICLIFSVHVCMLYTCCCCWYIILKSHRL